MPRSYFKHEHGYINLTEEAICFTRSGNWQEAENTTERVRTHSVGYASRIVLGILIIGTVGVFFGIAKAHGMSGYFSVPLFIGAAGFTSYRSYRKLRFDFGPSFRIPFSKIRSIE